ncbi:MAG TPA: CARDB domain-containing protein [Longimicrobiales bacterium]
MRPRSSLAFTLGITLALTLAMACGDEDPVEPPEPARLSLSPTSVGFTVVQGAGDPAEQTVSITNAGGGTLSGLTVSVSYAGGEPNGWLTATLDATTAPTTLTLSAATGKLDAGSYGAAVRVASAGANGSPRIVNVTLTVEPPPPAIALSPDSVAFSATAGGDDPPAQTVSVTNVGGGTLDGLGISVAYADGQPAGWLDASLAATTAPTTLSLAAATDTLATGTYTATVTVASGVATNGAQPVSVSFTVAPAPDLVIAGTLGATPTTVAAGDVVTLSVMNVRNEGSAASGDFGYGIYLSADSTITAADTWLRGDSLPSLAPATTAARDVGGATIPETIQPGSYYIGVLLDADDGVPESDETNNFASARLTVTAPASAPAIVLSQTDVSFEAAEGGMDPATQTVSVTNGGGGTLNGLGASITYETGQHTGWLSATLSSDVAPTTLTLEANVGTLPADTYTASVSVYSATATNGPVVLTVTFTVDAGAPDLAFTTPLTVTPTTAAPGGRISVTFSLANQGDGPAGAFRFGIYLSMDAAITADDELLFDGRINTLPPGAAYVPNDFIQVIPSGTAPGQYYIGIIADTEDAVVESDESNNVTGAPLTVAPEPEPSIALAPTSVSFSAAAGGADPASQTVAVSNGGGGTLSGLDISVSYTPGQPTGWLTASLNTTTAPATLTLDASTGSLPAGVYTAAVSVNSSLADNSPQKVAVAFTVDAAGTYTLTTDVSPGSPIAGGTVARDPDQPSYAAGTAVTLTATPSTGFRFGNWSGDVVSSANPVSVLMDRNKFVTANFLLEPPVLAQPDVSGQTIDLSWTYEWPCGTRCLVGSGDGYELEESTASPDGGFVTVFQASRTRLSPFSVSLTRSPGTYYYRVRARTPVGDSPYSEVRTVTVEAPSEITAYASADNTMLFSTTDPALAGNTYPTGDLGVGCNFSVLSFGTEFVCASSALKFDGLQEQIAGRTIRSAVLRLYASSLPADDNTTFGVNAFSGPWSPSTLTYANQPSYFTTSQAQALPPTSTVVPLEFDVTAIVQNWASGVWANNGLLVRDLVSALPPVSVIRATFFDSADSYDSPARRPQLIVTFD